MSDQSRRSLLVNISLTAIGSGLSSWMQATAHEADPLPPGLYDPSSDHLSHALMSADQFHAGVPGCPTDYVSAREGPFKPAFFSEAQFEMVCRTVALLLDEAVEQGVRNASVVQEVAEWMDLSAASASGVHRAALELSPPLRTLETAFYGVSKRTEADTSDVTTSFLEGLAWLDQESREQHGQPFLGLTMAQQIALLDGISDKDMNGRQQSPGARLFTLMKNATVRGFYTSRVGLKELDFKGNAYYARSPGCDARLKSKE